LCLKSRIEQRLGKGRVLPQRVFHGRLVAKPRTPEKTISMPGVLETCRSRRSTNKRKRSRTSFIRAFRCLFCFLARRCPRRGPSLACLRGRDSDESVRSGQVGTVTALRPKTRRTSAMSWSSQSTKGPGCGDKGPHTGSAIQSDLLASGYGQYLRREKRVVGAWVGKIPCKEMVRGCGAQKERLKGSAGSPGKEPMGEIRD